MLLSNLHGLAMKTLRECQHVYPRILKIMFIWPKMLIYSFPTCIFSLFSEIVFDERNLVLRIRYTESNISFYLQLLISKDEYLIISNTYLLLTDILNCNIYSWLEKTISVNLCQDVDDEKLAQCTQNIKCIAAWCFSVFPLSYISCRDS